MIRKLEIRNFQSHRNTVLEFCSGLNMIIGKTDAGKTSILRALRWNIWNRPTGDRFRSCWGGNTEVTITTSEDNVISRSKKGSSGNFYHLNGLSLEAFKTEVPKEVSDVLNMSEINFQSQFEQPFLLTKTPGEIALHFNKIAHIDMINTATSKVNSWIQNLNQTLSYKEGELTQQEEKLKAYEEIDKQLVQLEVLEEKEKQWKEEIKSLSKLTSLIQSIKEIEQQFEEISKITSLEGKVNAILAKYDAVSEVEKDRQKLLQIVKDIVSIQEQTAELDKYISLEDSVTVILNKYEEINQLKKEVKDLNKIIIQIEQTKMEIQDLKEFIQIHQDDFDREMPDKCPLCGAPKDWKLKH